VAKAHPIPVLIGKCTETVTPFVCATLFSHTLVAAEALSLRIQSDATTLDIADAIRITFTGRHEWQTVSLERSGGRCDLRLADHTFPLRSPKGKSES
jgi:hypothetical protein